MRRVAAACALGLLGCSPPPPRSALEAVERDPRGFVAEVAALRGLPDPRPAALRFHDEAEFLALVEAHAEPTFSGPEVDTALPVGATPVTAARLRREQVVAFFDAKSNVIHVRRGASRSPELLWTLAHEVGHSLQAQNFRLPDLDRIPEEDAFLAALSVVEGDAMLTMLAFVAHENHVPLRRALVQVARKVERGEYDEAVRASGTSPELMRAPAALRERLLFPYARGAVFLGALHRTGGFALVNRVYDQLPVSTEQVLHPEKYLAGELPLVVPPPPGPARQSGRLGELGTRVLLGQCLPSVQAEAAAAGWGGDRLTVRADGAVLWNTVWDRNEDATEFEQALRTNPDCWGELSVLREGARVAVARGPGVDESTLRALLAAPVAAPRALAPFGALRVPRAPPLPNPVPPLLTARFYVNERLGIRLLVPPGFVGRIADDILVLARTAPPRATASLAISDLEITPETLELLFTEFAAGFAETTRGELEVLGTRAEQLSLGVAVARTWAVRDGPGARLRVVLLPICNRTGAIAFSELWWDAAGRQELDRWLAGLMPLRPAPPPICAELDP